MIPQLKKYAAHILIALAAILGTVTVVITVTPGDDGTPQVNITVTGPKAAQPLPVVPALNQFDSTTRPPGAPAPSDSTPPGQTEHEGNRAFDQNEQTEDEKYDTSRVLEGATPEPRTIKAYTSQNGGPRSIRDILIGVVHVTVSSNVFGLADGNNLASFFRNVQASPTWTVDNEGNIWENVPLGRIPWTQAAYNRRSCSIEFVGSTGRPKEGAAQWTDVQLRAGAKLIAWCFAQAHIPAQLGQVDNSRTVVTRPGIVTHQQLGLPGGGHTDPGPFFNMPLFLSYVKLYSGQVKKPSATARRQCQELNRLRKISKRTRAQGDRAQHLKRNLTRHGYVCTAGPPGKIRRK